MKHSLIMAGAAVLVLAGCAWGQQLVKPGKAVYANSGAHDTQYLSKLLHKTPLTADEEAYLDKLGLVTALDINAHKEKVGQAVVIQIGDIPVSAGVVIDGSVWAPVSNMATALGGSIDHDAHFGRIVLTPPAPSDGPAIKNVITDDKATLAYVKDVSVSVKFAGDDATIKALADKGVTEDSVTTEITSKVKAAGITVDDKGDTLFFTVTWLDEKNGTLCYSMYLRLYETVRMDCDLTMDDDVPTFSTEGLSSAPKDDPSTPVTEDVDSYVGVFTNAYTQMKGIFNK